MRWRDRHTASYTGRLRPHLIIQHYEHIIFPLKSLWYTALHFHNWKNSSCFPKNYRKPKSLSMLLAIWFIVYLQLSWECHAFTLTNYMGGAFRDQLERWELLSAQPKAPVKQNELTACWRVTLLCLEKRRKIRLWVQPHSDTVSVWGKFRIVTAEQSRAGMLYIVDTLLLQEPILASVQASVSSESCTSILPQVWKQHRYTYLLGLVPDNADINRLF